MKSSRGRYMGIYTHLQQAYVLFSIEYLIYLQWLLGFHIKCKKCDEWDAKKDKVFKTRWAQIFISSIPLAWKTACFSTKTVLADPKWSPIGFNNQGDLKHVYKIPDIFYCICQCWSYLSLLSGSPQLKVLSHVFSNLYLVTPTVQSSCKFYLSLICRLLEYALLHLFSLWESKAGEQGGCFGMICWVPGRHFNISRLEVISVLWVLPLLVPYPRQGGVWITLHTPKAALCLPWACGAVNCRYLGFLGSDCLEGFQCLLEWVLPTHGPAPPGCCWKQCLREFQSHFHLGLCLRWI